MIVSASRRTDIPAFYSDWFFRRIRERTALVRNPVNIRRIGRIDLSPDVVDCIVFWTKNPRPMIERLDELNGYAYYFQFTLNAYGRDIEPRIPEKAAVLDTFMALSEKIGKERVIWRYDPILINAKYSIAYHLRCFERIANALKDHTEKCTISFIDFYGGIKKSMERLGVERLNDEDMRRIAKSLSEIASGYGLETDICAEDIDLEGLRIARARCIDDRLIGRIAGFPLRARKDRNQRPACGCVESVDIGAYNTCANGCAYCYANHNPALVKKNVRDYDERSPLLCSRYRPDVDTVYERSAISLLDDRQLGFSR